MSNIAGLIQPQAFELIRDRIGEILADELPAQYALSDDETWLNAQVWVDRYIPFDKSELPAVNVSLVRGEYDGQTAIQSDGTYLYNIDAYVGAKTEGNSRGDALAMSRLQRLLGVCRAILESSHYITLGFDRPFVMNRKVLSIGIADPDKSHADSSVMGRLQLQVKVPENVETITPNVQGAHYTTVKLSATDKGYLYIHQE